jgi:outer membrane lipoprotein-sorting protein
MKKLFFLFLLLLTSFAKAQDAKQILDGLSSKINRVHDYSVSAKIKSDIPLIKVFTVNATLYFKQKDKFRIVSKGIAVLPKQGFADITKLLSQKDAYTPITTGSETIGGTKAVILTLLPASDTIELVLAKLWVDTVNHIVLKSQVTTRSNGTVTAEYTFGTQKEYGLPDSILFTVDVKKFKIPKGIATDINRTKTEENKPPAKTGKISVVLTDYVINKGIDDSVFRQ